MKIKKLLLPLLIILGGITMTTLAGCENKNSRAWIEDKVSAVEQVYPTKNLYDLFEKFPTGFTILVNDLYDKDGQSFSREIHLIGDPKTREIKGNVSLTLLEKEELEPVVETIVDESELTYTRNNEFILSNTDASPDLFPYKDKGFLFQHLTLNKKILASFELEEASHDWQSEITYIKYKLQNSIINDYLDLSKNSKVSLSIFPIEDFLESGAYAISIDIKFKENVMHIETIKDGMEVEND